MSFLLLLVFMQLDHIRKYLIFSFIILDFRLLFLDFYFHYI